MPERHLQERLLEVTPRPGSPNSPKAQQRIRARARAAKLVLTALLIAYFTIIHTGDRDLLLRKQGVTNNIALASAGPGPDTLAGVVRAQVAAGAATAHPPQQPQCRIHILDVAEHASDIGIPSCDLSDPDIWPHNQSGHGLQGMWQTPHWKYQHGSGHWIQKAIRTSPHYTASPDDATVTFVDLNCYNQWFHSFSQRFRDRQADAAATNQTKPQVYIQKALDHVIGLPQFKASGGRDFAFNIPSPSGIGTDVYGKYLCDAIRGTYTLVTEVGMICHLDQAAWFANREPRIIPFNSVPEVDLHAPIVGSHRPTFLYFRSGCSNSSDRSSGMLQRYNFINSFVNKSADVQVECSCAVCPNAKRHGEVQKDLTQSLFCPVLSGDCAGSARLTEVMLAGCIPVFIGRPWHTMYLAQQIDYKSFAVFINVTQTDDWLLKNSANSGNSASGYIPRVWIPLSDVSDEIMTVPTIRDVEAALRSMSRHDIQRRQKALERWRRMFWYPPLPGSDASELGSAIIDGLCQRGAAVHHGS